MASIKKRSGTYYVIYDYYTTVDSKRVRKSKWEPFSNEEDAKIRKAEIDLDKAKNSFVNPSDMTVKEFFEKWLPIHARKRWSYKTLMQSSNFVNNHIYPIIGEIPLQKLTTLDIENMYDVLRQKKKARRINKSDIATAKNKEQLDKCQYLSATTLHEIHVLLNSALNAAVEWKYIRESPIPREAPPKNRDYERQIWDEDQMHEALSLIQDKILHLAVHLAIIGSLRIGEVTAITRECIDYEKRRIFICKTLQRVEKASLDLLPNDRLVQIIPPRMKNKKSCLILKTPKTRSSKRYMYLTDPLLEEIKLRISEIERLKRRLGDQYSDFGLLICLPDGYPIEPKLMEKWFKEWQADMASQNKCLPSIEFHGIRHSSATYKLELSHGDVKSVQGETGHADGKMILDKYAHTQERKRKELSDEVQKDFYKDESLTDVQKNDSQALLNTLLENVVNNPDMQTQILLALLAQKSTK